MSKDTCFHIVLAPLEPLCPRILINYLEEVNLRTSKKVAYLIAIEYGTGHKHIDCFIQYPEERRQDSVRRGILKLYPEIPSSQLINCKVTINTIDPNPMYGFGYTMKEHIDDNGDIIHDELYSNLENEILYKSYEYYKENEEKVRSAIAKRAEEYKHKSDFTMDKIVKSFQDYSRDIEKDQVDETDWKRFLRNFPMIPFSVYQKINQEKLIDYVNNYLCVSFS